MLNNRLRGSLHAFKIPALQTFIFAVVKNLEMLARSLLAGEGVPIGRCLCNIPYTGYHNQLAADCAPRDTPSTVAVDLRSTLKELKNLVILVRVFHRCLRKSRHIGPGNEQEDIIHCCRVIR